MAYRYVIVSILYQPMHKYINIEWKACVFQYWYNEIMRTRKGLTRVSRVLDESGQKLIRIKIYKKNLTQPDPNPWWAGWLAGSNPFWHLYFK